MIPLVRRFPELASVPRVALGRGATPIVPIPLASALWIKRDDVYADPIGGNKARALEFLLGAVSRGSDIATVGSEGSTHALAVAVYGKRLDAKVFVGRWRQERNDAAARVSARIERTAFRAPVFRNPVGAYAWALTQRARGASWIPAGGSTPLGILGHVNAGLELLEQIDVGMIPAPKFVVVPLGTGGTAAGLALAFAASQRDITVVGARVVPWIVARKSRVVGLARGTARLIEQLTGERLPPLAANRLVIENETYGGAYGRETEAGRHAAEQLRTVSRIGLDATYSAKAFGHALALASRGSTLFWLTFDSRILGTT